MSAQEHRNKRSQSLRVRTSSRELIQLTELSTSTEAVYSTRPAAVSYPSCSVTVNGKFILVNCRYAIYRYDIINNAWQKCEDYDDDDDDDDDDYADVDISTVNKEPITYHLCNAHREDHQGNIFALIKDLNSKDHRLNSCEIIPTELEWFRTAALYLEDVQIWSTKEEYDKKHVPNIDPVIRFERAKHRFFCTRDITQADMWRIVFVDHHMDIVHQGVVYIPSQHRMLFFGGRTRIRNRIEAIDTIREYDLNKQAKYSWSIINEVKLPYKMFGFGYILTADEQHIVIFGGETAPFPYSASDKILVIDLKTMTISQSAVKCPDSGTFRAIAAPEWERNGKLVAGFIQTCAGEIPSDVCDLINLYYKEEYVHLIRYEYECQRHWKMNIKQIISNTFDIGDD